MVKNNKIMPEPIYELKSPRQFSEGGSVHLPIENIVSYIANMPPPTQPTVTTTTTTATPQQANNDDDLETRKTLSSVVTSTSILNTSIFSNSIVGLLERIPLMVKLIMVVAFAILSLFVFGSLLIVKSVQQIQSAYQIQSLSELSVLLADVTHQTQIERGSSSLYLGSGGKSFTTELPQYRNDTDKAILAYQNRKVTLLQILGDDTTRIYKNSEANLKQVDAYISGLPAWREKIWKLQFNVTKVALDYYTNWNTLMVDTILMISGQSTDATFTNVQTVYNFLTAMKEYNGLKRAVGSNGLAAGRLSVANYNYFLQIQTQSDLLQHYLDLKSNDQFHNEFIQRVTSTPVYSLCKTMESYIVNNYLNLTLYKSTDWFNNMTLVINAMRDVETVLRNSSLQYADDLNRQAIGSLVGFTVSTFFVTCLSTTIAIVFSKTIVGPWKKILSLQEDTVHKFVPREFMTIVNKDKVTDLRHGDFFEKELDIMFVDVRNYTGISESLTSQKVFKFINKYLKVVGPIIRRHNAYIDKYLGDGFAALFLEPGQSVHAAIAIQNSLEVFNETLGHKYPNIAVGIGIVRGNIAVGLVGESKRMDPTIIGDSVNLSARLESLTKQYGARILVSKNIIETTPHTEDNFFRRIGKVAVVGKKEAVELFEILPFEDCPRRSTKDLFESATDLLYNPKMFNPEASHAIWKQITSIDPDDMLAQMRFELSEQLMEDSTGWDFCDRPTKK